MKTISIVLLLLTYSLQALSDNLSDSNKLFNWAEANYPQYFNPPKEKTFKVENYWVRYYKSTNIYVGTLGDEVYVYGDVFNGLKHIGRIGDFVDVTEGRSKVVGNVKVVGSDAFISQTEAALSVLKSQAPRAFKRAEQNISVIEQTEFSHMWSDEVPPRYAVGEKSSFKSIKWYAGTIAHEATHSALYQAYLAKNGLPVPASIWRSDEAENVCIAYQIEVMEQVNAPKADIDYLNDELNGTNCDVAGNCE